MIRNEGGVDRILRAGIGLILGGIAVYGFSTGLGVASWVFAIAGGISILTAITGFCGLYTLLGINTCRISLDNEPDVSDKA